MPRPSEQPKANRFTEKLEKQMSSVLQLLNNDLSTIVTQTQRSLVRVLNGNGAGAGTIWHSDGLIITNAHVVARSRSLEVALPDGRTFPAAIVARDDSHDLAALAIQAHDLPTIEPGDSNQLYPGQWVMALGHPWGVADAVTGGIVIGAGADLIELSASTGRDWVAVSLHLRPGHSGGPLIDVDGRLVGVNTLMTGPDVGAAVPVNTVKAFLKREIGTQKPDAAPSVRGAATPEFV
jgi:serine protease Do